MEKKKWYESKSIWVGAIALVGGILQAIGFIELPISAETQLAVIGFIGLILRAITGTAISW